MPDTMTVDIVHSNDVYGQLRPVEVDSNMYGGMARRVHVIRTLREAGPTLALDAGNALGPEALSTWDRGKVMMEAMRLAGYAAIAPGNHEFDYGLDVIAQRHNDTDIPFLAANVRGPEGRDLPIDGYRLFDVDGVKIGVVGLVSRTLRNKINPNVARFLVFEDPVSVLRTSVATLDTLGASYIIVLAHMPADQAMAIAQAVPSVNLIIMGGYQGLDRAQDVPALTRLVNGVNLVTTPRGGSHLGLFRVTFARSGKAYHAIGTQARTLAISDTVAVDMGTWVMVDSLVTAYDKETGEELGLLSGKTLEAQAEAVANLLRWHTKMEVGIVYRGVFQGMAPSDSLFARDVERFVRFDDVLVKMQLTGSQLKGIVRRSQRAGKGDAGLIFAGLDPQGQQVNGRDIQDKERYNVVTLAYLADGGEGYREFLDAEQVQRTGISLQSLLITGLRAWGTLGPETFARLGHRRVWRSGWHVEGAFRRNYFDGTARAYQDNNESVSFLRGETSIAWNMATQYYLQYTSGPHVVSFENNNDFGQVGTSFGSLETSSDRLDAEMTYRLRIRKWNVDPFVSSGINTAFTANNTRPFQWRNSLGFQRRFGHFVVQFAGRGQRDFAEGLNDFGAEITLSYDRRFHQGGRLRSRVNNFFGLTDRKVISIENDNTLSFPLAGALSLTVRQNNFIYRVDKIHGVRVHGVAFRTDLTVGLAYGLDWKWF